MTKTTKIEYNPTLADLHESIQETKAILKQLLAEKDLGISPWIKGDAAAAKFAGYRSRQAFTSFARRHRIFPRIQNGIKFWSREDIKKARERSW
jgi:urocanate hydratase